MLMRWSISLPGPTSPGDLGTVPALLKAAHALEAFGFDAGWVSDHPFPKLVGGNEHHAADPFSTLAFLANATDRLLLQTGIVVAPFRNPFLLANQAATVDFLSGGRLILGFGTGYLEPEFTALGADFRRRGKRTQSAVAAWKQAWSGEPVTLEGDGFEATGNTLRPLPVRRPHPILWRGGNSDAAIRQAALECDGWNPAESPAPVAVGTGMNYVSGLDALRDRIGLLRSVAADAGRDQPIDVILNRPDPEWRQRPVSEMRDELAALAEIGVTWIAVWLREATSLADYLRKLEAIFAALD
jgi:probable F420-dependent oxidoreductase